METEDWITENRKPLKRKPATNVFAGAQGVALSSATWPSASQATARQGRSEVGWTQGMVLRHGR
jgi:hypothetical protein